jgi:hypothetical protein
LDGRAEAGAVTGLVRRSHADVLFFVQELTGEAARRLERAGPGGLLPHQVTQPAPRGTAGRIYARYPLRGGLHTCGAAEAALVPGGHGPVAQPACRASRARRRPVHPGRGLQRHR